MRFSIVIPTRNRAGKLVHALSSALAQSFDDFEVVVSNNQSTDDTRAVVEQQMQPRLRYVEAPRSMSMVDHWEFALSQARGEWVLFVCDDDALMPGALANIARISDAQPTIELIQYGVLVYVYDDGTAAGGNYIDIPERLPPSCDLINSRACLARCYRRLSGDMPKFLNSAVRRSLIDRIRKQHHRIFWDWAPDYSSATLLLANTQQFAHIGPQMLWGENMESYGAGSARNPAHLQSFFSQFETFKGNLPRTPYPQLLTVQNCVFDTFARMKELLGSEFTQLHIDPIRYRKILLKDCRRYLENGFDEYSTAIAQLQNDLKELKQQRLLSPRWSVRAAVDGVTDVSTRLQRSLARRLARTKHRNRHHFANIHEAAQAVGKKAA